MEVTVNSISCFPVNNLETSLQYKVLEYMKQKGVNKGSWIPIAKSTI